MSKCLSCGKDIKDGEFTCTTCQFKYGQSHVIVSQEEYQQLRYKEMLYDASLEDNNSLN